MRKGVFAVLILTGLLALFYVGSILRCKAMAKGASSRVGYSFRDGCYIELSGERVPLK
jgi:hypothetical protein